MKIITMSDSTPMTKQEAAFQKKMEEIPSCRIKKQRKLDFDALESIIIMSDNEKDSDIEILGELKKSPKHSIDIKKSKLNKPYMSETIRKKKETEEKMKTLFYNHTKTLPLSKNDFKKYCRKVSYFKIPKRPWSAYQYVGIYQDPTDQELKDHLYNQKLYEEYLNYNLDYIKNNNIDLFNQLQSQLN